MKVNIKDREIEVKTSFRAQMIYENNTGHTFEIGPDEDGSNKVLNKMINYLYACIIASDRGLILTFDDFLDWLDDNPDVLSEFISDMIEEVKLNIALAQSKMPDGKKKAKVDKKK